MKGRPARSFADDRVFLRHAEEVKLRHGRVQRLRGLPSTLGGPSRPRPRRLAGKPGTDPERGFALLLVLLLSSIALVLVADLSYQSRLEHLAAENVSDLTSIEYSIDGHLELALAHLTYDKKQNEVDSEYDEWNKKELQERKDEGVALRQWIQDEAGKFNLHLLAKGNDAQQARAKDVLMRILDRFREETDEDLSQGTAQDFADRIAAYLKRDGTAAGGVPRPKTQTPGMPLLLDEIVFVDPKNMPGLLVDKETKEEGKPAPGLWRYLTAFGDGKVNLNTASAVVLGAYFTDARDRDFAQAIVDRRNQPPSESGTGGTGAGMTTASTEENAAGNPFTDVNQLTDGSVEGAEPLTLQILTKNGIDPGVDFTTKSEFFSVRIHGETERTRRMELYVVERVKTQTADGFRFLLHQERTDPLLEGAGEPTER
jgi:type II secretory pathway component PulK